MSVENIRFRIGDQGYLWGGHLGAVLYSDERCINVGDVRCIEGVMFKVYSIFARPFWFTKATVRWVFAEDEQLGEQMTKISDFRRKLFGA